MTTLPQEGTTSNRYTILGRLAGGGMADIFLVRATSDAGVERFVVLKRVLAERGRDPLFATMFLDEARLSAQLQHPNIAQVHDIGKLAGSYFYTMEYVHGEDVRALLKRLTALHRPFPLALAFHVAAGALAALHHAHERAGADGKGLGIVHRDVSPSNVMVSYEGVIKLLDFGVAKARQRSVESRAGTIKGKIAYLSPEQCQGHDIDRRSDLFSLGILLHEMLTCKRLYRRDTDFATMSAIVSEPSFPPSSVRPELSAEVDRIVLTALAKNPTERYPTASAMLEAIEAVAAKEGHVLSATAMSRFMRELFGDRPEPWIELQADDDEPRPVTVTGESLASQDLLPITTGATGRPELDAAATFEDQLAHALPLPRPPTMEMSPGPLSVSRLARETSPPLHPSSIMTRVSPHMPTGSSPIIATYPVVQRAPGPPVRRPQRRRGLTIAIATLGALVVALTAIAIFQRSGGREVPIDAPRAVAVAMPTAPPEPAPPVDAAPPTFAIDAAPPTIADAIAAGDFAGALAQCTATHPLTPDDRALCGVAACNLEQRTAAFAYYASAPRASQPTIDRACREHGILLVAPVRRPPPPPTDPCDDHAWAEANPLKCQK